MYTLYSNLLLCLYHGNDAIYKCVTEYIRLFCAYFMLLNFNLNRACCEKPIFENSGYELW